MPAEEVDGVIGVDTHRGTLVAVAMSALGAVLAHTEAATDQRGYRDLLAFARKNIPGDRCWVLEGTGRCGAGLAAFLGAAGERVVEVCRPKRPPQRGRRETDAIAAVRAAREVLTAEYLLTPRRRGERAALRVLLAAHQGAISACTAAISHLKSLIVSAPGRPEGRAAQHGTESTDLPLRQAPGSSRSDSRAPHDRQGDQDYCRSRSSVAGRSRGARNRERRAGRKDGAGLASADRGRSDQCCPDPGQLVTPRTVPL